MVNIKISLLSQHITGIEHTEALIYLYTQTTDTDENDHSSLF